MAQTKNEALLDELDLVVSFMETFKGYEASTDSKKNLDFTLKSLCGHSAIINILDSLEFPVEKVDEFRQYSAEGVKEGMDAIKTILNHMCQDEVEEKINLIDSVFIEILKIEDIPARIKEYIEKERINYKSYRLLKFLDEE